MAHNEDRIPRDTYPELCKMLKASMWSCVKEHRSVKFEVGALACVRFWLKGARTVVLLREEAVLAFLRHRQSHSKEPGEPLQSMHAVSWATHLKQNEFDEFLTFSEDELANGPSVWYAQFSTPAALYLPAGIICGEHNGDADNVGLKTCVVVPADTAGHKLLRSLAGEARDQGKQPVVQENAVHYIDALQNDARGQFQFHVPELEPAYWIFCLVF